MSKEKRENKSKDQIAFEMKQKQEVERKRTFITEVLFPLLKEHTKTVREAKMFCKVVINDIQSTFNQGMKAPLSSLKLEEKFEKETDSGADAYRAVADAFADVSIAESLELLDGMPNAIDASINQENTNRPISDFDFKDGSFLPAPRKDPFFELLADTPLCNDFRQLADGSWVAYSTKMDGDQAIRASGPNMAEALINLKAKLI